MGRNASAAVLACATLSATAAAAGTFRRIGVGRGTVVGLVAFDLVGGLVAFQMRGTREKYAQSPLRSRLVFAVAHVQPIVLPLIADGSWRRAAARYLAAVSMTAALELVVPPRMPRRLTANGVGLALSTLDLVSGPSTQRWFGPVYLMKVIGGHAGIPRDIPDV
ncbi:hypothetical protein [Arthrobacter zhaoguopingii]|uniref:hypothetical protein n=1 Tax=Arthrobacter zhaoguopingii TaxID=2681491 RepID=UPI00135B7A77|nr:hypothetical protein [Arthrobacter zhaoguopingii]